VFAGGFSLLLAQRVISDENIDPWRVLDLLGHLIDKSLVIADGEAEPRYQLLETTRAFALEQLAASGESDRMLRRHAEAMCELMTAIDANCWNLSPAERRRAAQELGNLRAAADWVTAVAEWPLAHELMGNSWLVWLSNGLAREGVRRMLRLWPPSSDLSAPVEAAFCLGLARLHNWTGGEEHFRAARRAEQLYRELGNVDRLFDALLHVATIGKYVDHLCEAEAAWREAEGLASPAMEPRRLAALAATNGAFHDLLGDPEGAIVAFRRQAEICRSIDAASGECLAIGNIACVQLDSGDIDAAIDSLRQSVDGLRRISAPNIQVHSLSGKLALALALRGDDVDVLALARDVVDHVREVGGGGISHAMMAAALHHARRDDLHRAVLLAGHARHVLVERKAIMCAVDRRILKQLHDRAVEQHSPETVEAWWRAAERVSNDQAVALAFEDAATEGPP
jgi:hypothetical protein